MKRILYCIATSFLALPLLAQSTCGGQSMDGQAPRKHDSPRWEHPGPGMMHGGERMGAPMGAWWKNPEVAQSIGLTDAQAQKIEETFQEHRLQLIDLHADLQKQEGILQPLVDADQPDEATVMAQVDRVAQARAALEKSHASLLLAIRRVLTVDQWKKLQQRRPSRKHGFAGGPGDPNSGPPPNKPQGEGAED